MYVVIPTMLMETHVLYIRKATGSKKEYFKAECNRLASTEHPFAIYIYKN